MQEIINYFIDVPSIPNLYSGRIVIFTSVLFTYILYQFYSGGIVSSLLSEPPKTINDLKDLLHSPLQIGIEDMIYEKDFFDVSKTSCEKYKLLSKLILQNVYSKRQIQWLWNYIELEWLDRKTDQMLIIK